MCRNLTEQFQSSFKCFRPLLIIHQTAIFTEQNKVCKREGINWHGVQSSSQTSIWLLFGCCFHTYWVSVTHKPTPPPGSFSSPSLSCHTAIRRPTGVWTFLCIVCKSVWHVNVRHLRDRKVQNRIIGKKSVLQISSHWGAGICIFSHAVALATEPTKTVN